MNLGLFLNAIEFFVLTASTACIPVESSTTLGKKIENTMHLIIFSQYIARGWNPTQPTYEVSPSTLYDNKKRLSALPVEATTQTISFPLSKLFTRPLDPQGAVVLSLRDMYDSLPPLHACASFLSRCAWVGSIVLGVGYGIDAQSANLEVAARRLVYTKNFNCGQICLSADYVLVHEKVRRGPKRATIPSSRERVVLPVARAKSNDKLL